MEVTWNAAPPMKTIAIWAPISMRVMINEVPVFEDPFKDVQVSIQAPAIDRIEDLGEDKGVEDEGLDHKVVLAGSRRVRRVSKT